MKLRNNDFFRTSLGVLPDLVRMSAGAIPKTILVTGSHRSGSTWTGKVLAFADKAAYVHEPLNKSLRISVLQKRPDVWFPHIIRGNDSGYQEAFNNLLMFRYPTTRNLANVRTVADFAKLVRDSLRFGHYRRKRSRPILKDPIAIFASQWLHESFDMEVVILIRHPLAFCSSLKVKNWHFPFEDLLKQPELIENWLSPYADEIRDCTSTQKPIVEQAALAWNCFHCVINRYKELHRDWHFLRHEDLSLNPELEFGRLFEKLQLDFTPEVGRKIRRTTDSSNPIEQIQGNEFVRNSRANILNWKSRLTADEADWVREKTKNLADEFYPEYQW